MRIVHTIEDVRNAVAEARGQGLKIGLVPTMGALHDGHGSLIEAARAQCGYVVASVFVNPLQFGPAEDYAKYPRTLGEDAAYCEKRGALSGTVRKTMSAAAASPNSVDAPPPPTAKAASSARASVRQTSAPILKPRVRSDRAKLEPTRPAPTKLRLVPT